MPLGKSENRVNGIGQTGDAAGRLARRNHAVEYGANFVEQRGDRGSVGGKLLAELTNVLAPVARRIDAAVAEHVAVVDAPPFDLLGDAEALEDAVQRAAGMEPRKIVRAGVEAINADRALMPLPAMKVLAEAAGDGFRLVDGDLSPASAMRAAAASPPIPAPTIATSRPSRLAKSGAGQRNSPARAICRRIMKRMIALTPKTETSEPNANRPVVAHVGQPKWKAIASTRNKIPQKAEEFGSPVGRVGSRPQPQRRRANIRRSMAF